MRTKGGMRAGGAGGAGKGGQKDKGKKK
jgi:hypothetical protein